MKSEKEIRMMINELEKLIEINKYKLKYPKSFSSGLETIQDYSYNFVVLETLKYILKSPKDKRKK